MDALPERGIIFWPVGCGDSTTVVVDADTVVQIDIHYVEDSEGDDGPRIPVVDELVELLPKKDGKPYLAVFGATHLDKDHTQGFAELLDRVTIGDLWFTPRVLWEQDQDELCDDARRSATRPSGGSTSSRPTARSAPATGSASSGSLMI